MLLKVKDSSLNEIYFEEIFEHGFEGEDPLFDLRNYLYPDSEDPNVQVEIDRNRATQSFSLFVCVWLETGDWPN